MDRRCADDDQHIDAPTARSPTGELRGHGRHRRPWDDHRVLSPSRVHGEIQARLREMRARLAPPLVPAFDSLIERRGFLSDDIDTFFHPLGHPIAAVPMWVAAAVGDADQERLLDVIEATVAGYLYVRVHDDRLDEGIGDPDDALFLADGFLIRHQVLLARHVGASPRFWLLFERVAGEYATAMLLERSLLRAAATYGPAEFDAVLGRSRPLALPGAALLDVADRWELLEPLQRFVHHAVRAAQLVDDVLDCHVDAAAGRQTWVVRRLQRDGGVAAMGRNLVAGGLDEIVAEVLADLDAADGSARAIGMTDASEWLAARRAAVVALHEQILVRFLLG
jgi:hypothetical protein